MRAFLLLFTGMFVIGVIVFVVVSTPEPTQPEIVVPRLDTAFQFSPVIQNEVDPEAIMRYFPDVSEIIIGDASAEQPAENTSPSRLEEAGIKPHGVAMDKEDRSALLAMIDDWVYINFSQIGATKRGRINQTRTNNILTVTEGEVLSNGIEVAQLSTEAATLRLGQSVYHLPLAIEPDFFKEMKDSKNPRPLTPDEQKVALDYYMRRYGHKFKALSEGYQPPPGMKMPQQMTQEEYQESMRKYMNRQGMTFQAENEQFGSSSAQTEQQKEYFRQYWQKYHPDRPMPNFEDLQTMQNQFGPANRILPSGDGPGDTQP
jgi:hypothetical protein